MRKASTAVKTANFSLRMIITVAAANDEVVCPDGKL